tara:strand:+ start:2905 stop:3753 length:849 start_codon:yes stop_codon:yes gene_type:complete
MAGNEFYNLKPISWVNRLMRALKKSLIYGNLTNQNYTPQATVGGSVKFNQIGEVDTGDYTAYSDMTFQTLDDAGLTMKIDQQKYFAFQLDETDAAFIPPDVIAEGIDRGSYNIRDGIDSFISGKYADAGVTYGSAASPKATSSGTVVQHLAEFGEAMDEANIPRTNRWIVVPPWVFTKLTIAGVANKTPNADVFRDGYLGGVVGFSRMYMSNNVGMENTTTSTFLASSGNEAIGYAGAISGAIRILPTGARRATNIDGLWVYGAKVIRPDMLACMYSTETAN